jgi:AraC-like DNA-binding protein
MIFWIFNHEHFHSTLDQKKKYQRSTLKETEARLHFNNLLVKVSEEKLYLDPNLTLGKLAGMLCILPLHLSQIINDRCKQNFSDFINSYRIEEAKEKLASQKYEHLTIACIARESGFNSISSFNTAFKKKYNITPSQFRPCSD